MVRRRRGRVTRMRKVGKTCPHLTFHYEEGKGYVCDKCGTSLSPKEVKFRQTKWVLFLGPDPAGRGQSAGMYLGMGPPKS